MILAQAFVVAKDEDSTLNNRPPEGASELITAVFCNLAWCVELVARVQGGVSEEFIGATMKLAGTSAGNRVDDAPCRLAVVCRCVGCDDREFLNGINAEV